MEEFDTHGNRYSTGYKSLVKVALGIESILIKKEAIFISGQSSTNNSFFDCRNTIKDISFEEGSQLDTIQPFAVCSCPNVKVLNFTNCTKLKYIEMNAFSSCKSVNTLILPPNLLVIGQLAFWNLGFSSVVIPSSVEEIRQQAFEWCSRLRTVEYEPNSHLKVIEYAGFGACNMLKELFIPANVSIFGGNSFCRSKNIEKIIIDERNSMFKIFDGIVYSNDNRTLVCTTPKYHNNITVPSYVETLGDYCFASTNSTHFTLNSLITILPQMAWRSSKIKEIVIPKNILSISSYCFYESENLESITFQGNLNAFYKNTFCKCAFSSFDVPDGITSISMLCFSDCTSLAKVTFPSTLTSVGGGAFMNCHPTLKITFRNQSQLIIDSQLMILDKNNQTVISFIGSEENIKIPSTVTKINSYCFASKQDLNSISFNGESMITTIEDYAFSKCSKLISLPYLPKLKFVGKYAFELCITMESFLLGNSIETINIYAFTGCSSLNTITMKENCIKLILSDFSFLDCVNLNTFSFKEGLDTIGKSCFKGCLTIQKLVFPASLNAIYDFAFQSSGLTEVTFNSGSILGIINPYSFYESQQLQIFEFPNVRVIGKYGFSFTSISEVILPISVELLDDSCFQGCSKLERFIIPSSSALHQIGFSIFQGCSKMKTIESDPLNNFTIENEALFTKARDQLIVFPPASTVRFFYLPSTISIIKQSSFFGCSNLECVIIPEKSIHTIEAHAFENCSNLHFINIPLSVKNVGYDSFKGCKKLKCGITVDNKSTSFLQLLIDNGKLSPSSMKDCSNMHSCKVRNSRSIPLAFYTGFIFIFSRN